MSVAFITGAIKNTGLAIAEKFASEGFDVAISSRDDAAAKTTAASIAARYKVRAMGYGLCLSDVCDIRRVFSQINVNLGGLDVFVANSACLGIGKDFTEVNESDYDELMEVNVKGTYFCCQEASNLMKKNRHGSIVIISSVHSKQCIQGRSLYSVSKGALNSLARSLAIELGAYGIRANSIIAGAIRTDRWDDFSDGQIAAKRLNWPAGLESTGKDIANGAFYLGTDLSKTVTGTELTIDSGILSSLLPFNGGKKQ